MILTDIDGIKFELDANMVDGLLSKRKAGMRCTEVSTIMKDSLLVKESPAEIIGLIRKEQQA
jgi:hypothetical protein